MRIPAGAKRIPNEAVLVTGINTHREQDKMTTRTKTPAKAGKEKLTLGKRTLKDLTVKQSGPKAGFIMRDTAIVPTSGRH